MGERLMAAPAPVSPARAWRPSESFSCFFQTRIDRRYTRVHDGDMNTTSTATKTNARTGKATSVHATYKYGAWTEDSATHIYGTVCGQSVDRTGRRFQFTSDAVTCKRCLKVMGR